MTKNFYLLKYLVATAAHEMFWDCLHLGTDRNWLSTIFCNDATNYETWEHSLWNTSQMYNIQNTTPAKILSWKQWSIQRCM